jgi:hypothetical protein
MTNMEIFKSPSQAVLNIFPFNESILILMENRNNIFLEPVCHKLGNKFQRETDQGDGPEIIHSLRIIVLRNKSNKGSIDALQVDIAFIEIID